MDKSLPHQQQVASLPFVIVVLRARSNRYEDIQPLMPELLRQLPRLQPGRVEVTRVVLEQNSPKSSTRTLTYDQRLAISGGNLRRLAGPIFREMGIRCERCSERFPLLLISVATDNFLLT